jgi:cytochrome c553
MALKITEESKSLLICSRCHEAKSESEFYKRKLKGINMKLIYRLLFRVRRGTQVTGS